MTAAEEKIKAIELIVEANDITLIRQINSLLHAPTIDDYAFIPMSEEAFQAKIQRAEDAIKRGETTSHEDVKRLVKSWRH